MGDKKNIDQLQRKITELEQKVAKLEQEKATAFAESPSDMRHYRVVNESSNNVFYKYDLISDQFEYVSPSVYSQTGFTVKEFSNFKLSEVMARVHPDDLTEFEEQIAETNDDQKTVRMLKYRWRNKDGAYHWVGVNRSISYDDNEKPITVVGVVYDIARQKKVEDQLRYSKEYLQAILSSLHETVIAVYDRNSVHKFIAIPKEMEERYGITSVQVLGKSIPDIYPPEVSARIVAGIERIFDTAVPITSSADIELPRGTFVHEVSLTPMIGINGKVDAVVAFIRDITSES